MFSSPDVWMVFKSAKLMITEIAGVEHRMAECQLVRQRFDWPLAQELGEDVSVHLYDEHGAIRQSLTAVTLNPACRCRSFASEARSDCQPPRSGR